MVKQRQEPVAVGTVIDGKWVIEQALGEGGMGAVYAAHHVRNGLSVAVKVLHGDVAEDPVVRQRFLQEGYAANRVKHPGTVQVLDDGASPEGIVYLVMERLSGCTLDALAEQRGGTLAAADLLPYALAWVEVIASAHEVGIVHRDLKPENVMLCEDGRIKVLDFGLARVREVSSKMRLTVTSSPMGTPAFMPPEQALAHWDRVDARADVYALGASMFTLLTNRLVHEATTIPEMMVKVCTKPAVPVRTHAPHVPLALARVVDKALSFEPEDRYPSAAEMLQELRAVAVELGDRSRPRLTTLASGADVESFVEAPTVSVVVPGAAEAIWRAAKLVPEPRAERPTGTLASGANPHQTVTPVSSGTERRRRKRSIGFGVLAAVAFVVLACGTIVVTMLRDMQPAQLASPAGPSTSEPSLVPTAASNEPSTLPPQVWPEPSSAGADTSASAASSSSAPSASAAAPPAPASPPATTSSPRKPPPAAAPATAPPKPCKKDPYTLRCK